MHDWGRQKDGGDAGQGAEGQAVRCITPFCKASVHFEVYIPRKWVWPLTPLLRAFSSSHQAYHLISWPLNRQPPTCPPLPAPCNTGPAHPSVHAAGPPDTTTD